MKKEAINTVPKPVRRSSRLGDILARTTKVQGEAYDKLKPAFDALDERGYQGKKTAVLDLSIRARSVGEYGVELAFSGMGDDLTESEVKVPFCDRHPFYYSYSSSQEAQDTLDFVAGAIKKPQHDRLADYLKSSRDPCRSRNAFLDWVAYPLHDKELDAVAVRIKEVIAVVSKAECDEYIDLRNSIQSRYNQQKKGFNKLRERHFISLIVSASLCALALFVGTALPGGLSHPLGWVPVIAMLVITAVLATTIPAYAKKRLKADRLKYPLPDSVTVWRAEQMKQKAEEAKNQLDPTVVKVEP